MTATYTFDVFSSLDGYGAASANWTGYPHTDQPVPSSSWIASAGFFPSIVTIWSRLVAV